MPLVTNLRCFRGYHSPSLSWEPFEARLPQPNGTLKTLLSAYLELTGKTMKLRSIGSHRWRATARGFLGALYSSSFTDVPMATRYRVAKVFQDTALALAPDIGFARLSFPIRLEPTGELLKLATIFATTSLNPARIGFWKGWPIYDSRGKVCYLRLHPLYNRFGQAFTDSFLQCCARSFASRSADALPGVKEFAEFLANLPDHVTDATFQDPDWVESIVNSFFAHYFQSQHARGNKISVIKRAWAEFARLLEMHFLGVTWASLPAKVPVPPTSNRSGRTANIRSDATGNKYNEKLLTSVPLTTTDTEALELLFRTIEEDLNSIQTWAKLRVNRLRESKNLFKRLRQPAIDAQPGSRVGTVKINSNSLAIISSCAESIEARIRGDIVYPTTRSFGEVDLSRHLGIPNRLDLLAFAALLVIEHPSITPAFLQEIEVVRSGNTWSATFETDAGSYLVGYKKRKGPDRAQQKIRLNARSQRLVRDLVEATSPVRRTLISRKESARTRLFIGATSYNAFFDSNDLVKSAHTLRNTIESELRISCSLSREKSRVLAAGFTISRLRASAGVLVYIRTGSSHTMSQALGHTHYSSRLLDHYLPRPIQNFFSDRWIRIFQSALVCEAMKDTRYLLRASGFSTIEQLDSFLSKHALRAPEAGRKDERRRATRQSLVFNIASDVLMVLFSVEKAVAAAPQKACGTARMWAKVATLVRPHLNGRPDLAHIVNKAEHAADPALVAGVVYA